MNREIEEVSRMYMFNVYVYYIIKLIKYYIYIYFFYLDV